MWSLLPITSVLSKMEEIARRMEEEEGEVFLHPSVPMSVAEYFLSRYPERVKGIDVTTG